MSARPSDRDVLAALKKAEVWRATSDVVRDVVGWDRSIVSSGREATRRLAAYRTTLDQLKRRGLVDRRRWSNAILWQITDAGRAWLTAQEATDGLERPLVCRPDPTLTQAEIDEAFAGTARLLDEIQQKKALKGGAA